MIDREWPDLTADGFTGALMAVEGIRDAAALINGPTGCKFYHGALSEGQFPRETSMDPLQFSDEFYFGQPRAPATYLDDQDYVFGATGKLEAILPRVAEKGHRLIAVVNSPGAALIGDDLERFIAGAGLPVPCVAIESAGFSAGFAQGFQAAATAIFKRLSPPSRPVEDPRRITLVGLSIFHRHWEGDAAELRRLLGLCGIEVHAAVCAGCSVDDLTTLGASAAFVATHPEYADALAPFLAERFSRPARFPTAGAPVGFSESERWIEAVCRDLDADPEPALADIRSARKRAFDGLSRFNSLTGLPRGATFALRADGGAALPLTQWLYDYLGMVPIAVATAEATRNQSESLARYLADIGCADAWNADIGPIAMDLVFGGEDFISRFSARGRPAVGIDIALPGGGQMDVVPKCQLGPTGALWLLERIVNGLLAAC